MADITMCDGMNCDSKNKCYRHTAKKNEFRQSWFVKSPVDAIGLCEEFISNSDNDIAYKHISTARTENITPL